MDQWILQASLSKDSFIIGKRVNNLYIRGNKYLKTPTYINVNQIVPCKKNDVTLWHNRLGHLPFEKLRLLSLTNKECTNDLFNSCIVCYQARQHKLSFSLSETVSQQPFDLVHIDIWGPYKVPTHNGFR